MRNKILFLIIFFLCRCLPVTFAEEESVQLVQAGSSPLSDLSDKPAEVFDIIKEGMEGRISLDLRNIEVTDALKFLSMKAGLNIIATKSVAGRITLMVDSVPIRDVFDIMLRSNGLAYKKEGDIYNIMTEEEYLALFGKRFADIRRVKVFRIQYAIPEQVFSLLNTLKSEVGRVLVEPDSGTALVMDTPENIQQIEEALSVFEQKNSVRIFNLRYARAKDMEEQLKTQLDAKKVGSIKADERSNQVVVQTLPERMKEVETLVEALDTKTKEVLIDAKIIKIKLTDEMSTGIEWEGLFSAGRKFGMMYVGSYPFSVLQASTAAWQSRNDFLTSIGKEVGAYPFSGNTASVSASTKTSPGEKMHVGLVGTKKDVDFMLKYLQTLGRTQILSNPKLAVVNNQEAKIHVGERQAYVTTTTTTGQTTTTVSEEVTFVDVGIQLSVTPTINDDGYVTMKVKPEISSVVSTLITPTNNKIPIIDTSMAETTVMVKDGATIIIGGMRREEKTSTSEQVPLLSRIPLIGYFFRNKTSETEKTELLVMLTPHIVSGDSLTTGDERVFGTKPGKDYKDYPAFVSETDFSPPAELPEHRMKPYKEYESIQEKETQLTPPIKGAESRE